MLSQDLDLKFLLENWDGDAFKGYTYIANLFQAHIRYLVSLKRVMQVLFGVYVTGLLAGYYLGIFLAGFTHASSESTKALR